MRRPRPIRVFSSNTAAVAAAALVCGAGYFAPVSSFADGDDPPATPAALISANPATPSASAVPRIFFGGAPLPVSNPLAAPFRDTGGDGEIYVSPEMLAPLGVTFIDDDRTGQVTLSAPDGSQTISLPARRIDGKPGVFVPAVRVIEALGGKCEWNAAANTLYARAVLLSAEVLGGQLRLRASLPILPAVRIDKGSRLVVIDVPGAEIGALAKSLSLSDPNILKARAGQFEDDVARLALNTKAVSAFAPLSQKPSMQVTLNPSDPDKAASLPLATAVANASATAAAVSGGSVPSVPAKPASGYKPAPVSHVNGVTFRKVSDDHAQLVVSADRAPAVRAGLSKGRLTLDFPNATLAASATANATDSWQHPFLKAAQIVSGNSNTAARLILDLTKAVGYTIRTLDGGKLLVDLSASRFGSEAGKLAGKTVVVDAGHGAHDSGARGGGYSEKNVTLAIATQLAQQLRDAGANVIMTRNDDTFVPVDDRPTPGNRAAADFFVSVHADSGDRNHSVSGSTVYFHMDWSPCKDLASSIADRLANIGGISSRGVHSDSMKFGGRFVNGYGVLRLSQMVAVLVECGYMSNSADVSKLNDSGMQKKIAGAICDGLKNYAASHPDLDTRFINPQPDSGLGGYIPGPGDDPNDSGPPPAGVIPAQPPPADAGAAPQTPPASPVSNPANPDGPGR